MLRVKHLLGASLVCALSLACGGDSPEALRLTGGENIVHGTGTVELTFNAHELHGPFLKSRVWSAILRILHEPPG